MKREPWSSSRSRLPFRLFGYARRAEIQHANAATVAGASAIAANAGDSVIYPFNLYDRVAFTV